MNSPATSCRMHGSGCYACHLQVFPWMFSWRSLQPHVAPSQKEPSTSHTPPAPPASELQADTNGRVRQRRQETKSCCVSTPRGIFLTRDVFHKLQRREVKQGWSSEDAVGKLKAPYIKHAQVQQLGKKKTHEQITDFITYLSLIFLFFMSKQVVKRQRFADEN